jgi:transcriptional pleiotropic regulator of transition state genes
MKNTGIVRKLDELGRITLPIELRRTLNITERDPIEIFVDEDKIVLQKYEATKALNDRVDKLRDDIIANVSSPILAYKLVDLMKEVKGFIQ